MKGKAMQGPHSEASIQFSAFCSRCLEQLLKNTITAKTKRHLKSSVSK